MNGISVGSIVRCREREWVVLPSDDREVVRLRPLTGGENEVCGIYRPLIHFGMDRIEPAHFPHPDPNQVGNAVGTGLLFDAARLTLRDGAGPFRSLGRISVRPRPYQLVPLLMALKLDPVRLLIADDVGVGKTIEALIIVRELLDRGEIRRICVLCPPYLCDQWQKELTNKFHIEAVVVRSGTISQLERNIPSAQSVFGYYPFTVVSIDFVKMDTHRANFLQHCPECVIVDEVHGAALPSGNARGQQLRHELLRKLVEDDHRHLVFLSATPHSGVESSFLSLLGLLQPQFEHLDLSRLTENQRETLARHFVQRRRIDVEKWTQEVTPFPQRDTKEETYRLSAPYQNLFNQVYQFSRQLVRSGETLTGWKQRIRYWTALALLRCVMSSPAAAVAALEKRKGGGYFEEYLSDESYSPYVYDPTDEESTDVQPTQVVEEGEKELTDSERKSLREFSRLAGSILGSDSDTKLITCTEIVRQLLAKGRSPIVWCRYIATSDYLAAELQHQLDKEFPHLRVVVINGTLADEERRARIDEISTHSLRVCVATDCLSEGINLQESFDSVIHYDLPWNPNRLEQRDGRVDRFGQRAGVVESILLYGSDNLVDGAVLDVLLRKARQIHKTLGITVPVPADSETAIQAILKNLFFRKGRVRAGEQLSLFEEPLIDQFHRRWDSAADREKESRTRFAQRSLKPEEVMRELNQSDSILGNPQTIRTFVLNALQRLEIPFKIRSGDCIEISGLDRLPSVIQSTLPVKRIKPSPSSSPFRDNIFLAPPQERVRVRGSANNDGSAWLVSFTVPVPENATSLGRNHPFVAGLAQYLFEEAFEKGVAAHATRCGVIQSDAVALRTHLYLLRLRFTLEQPKMPSLLAEEVLTTGFRGSPGSLEWLSDEEALLLLNKVEPKGNLTQSERREFAGDALAFYQTVENNIEKVIENRRKRLEESHLRVRSSAGMIRRGTKVIVHRPADLLGFLVVLPLPKGVSSS